MIGWQFASLVFTKSEHTPQSVTPSPANLGSTTKDLFTYTHNLHTPTWIPSVWIFGGSPPHKSQDDHKHTVRPEMHGED